MSTVHLILQGKGGVGKIVHRGFTGQYLQEKGVAVRCFDADPVNCLSALGNVSPVFQARFGRKI
jgi:CO dehydrogenase nickel-insertion accessory protein CooC1